MAEPLHFTRSETLKFELQRIDLTQRTLDAPQLTFNLPRGAGAWDFNQSFLHAEFTVEQLVGGVLGPVTANNNPKQMASEFLGDCIWQDLQMKIGGESVGDESAGNLAHIASFYRKMLTKPSGWASGGTQVSAVSLTANTTAGGVIAPASIVSGSTTIDAAGLPEGYALSTVGSGVSYNGANQLGYRTVIGVGGGSDPRAILSPQAYYRSTSVVQKAESRLILKSWPAAGATTCGSLIPCSLPIEMMVEKNRMEWQLSQTAANTGALRFTLQDLWFYGARIYPVAEVAERIMRPIRVPWVNHRLVAQQVAGSVAAGAGQEEFIKILTGQRPDKLVIALVANEAYSGGGAARRISPVAAGRHSAVTIAQAAIAGAYVEQDAPYATITNLQCRWNAERYPSLAYRSTDRDQAGLVYMYEQYKHCSRKCLSFQQFCNYSFFVVDLARDQNAGESGQLDISLSYDRRDLTGAAAGAGQLRLLVLGLYGENYLDIDAETGAVSKSWA